METRLNCTLLPTVGMLVVRPAMPYTCPHGHHSLCEAIREIIDARDSTCGGTRTFCDRNNAVLLCSSSEAGAKSRKRGLVRSQRLSIPYSCSCYATYTLSSTVYLFQNRPWLYRTRNPTCGHTRTLAQDLGFFFFFRPGSALLCSGSGRREGSPKDCVARTLNGPQ